MSGYPEVIWPPRSLSTPDRSRAALPFAVTGAGCVIAGGLVAAATAPVVSEHGTWAAAYLVLVAGVIQLAVGVGQASLAPRPPTRPMVATEFAAWNAGNSAVLAGTLLGATWLVDAGGGLIALALALLAAGVRGTGTRGWWTRLYLILIAVVVMSVLVGLFLAHRGPA